MLRSKSWACLLGIASIGALPAQVITTVAGGDWVFPTVDLSAANAPLGRISGVAVDGQKNVYVSDRDNCMVMKIDTQRGVISAFAGTGQKGYFGDGGLALSAKFNCPAGLAVDTLNNVYIADVNNHAVRIVTPDGHISTIVGSGTAGLSGDNTVGPSKLNLPTAVALDATFLYIVDTGNNRIRRRYLQNGFLETYAGGGAGGTKEGLDRLTATLEYPVAVAPDGAGNLLFVDNQRLRQVAPNGQVTTLAGNGTGGNNGPAISAALAHPCGIAIDNSGTSGAIYVTESNGYVVRKIVAGTISLFASVGSDTINTDPNIIFPAGVATDSDGVVYAADAITNHVARILPSGSRTPAYAGNGNYRFNGDGPAVSTTLNTPQAIVADSAGNVYVADTLNNRVRKFTRNGSVTTIAGTNVPGYNGDNRAAFNASLNHPTALAFDKLGNLYIADALNHRIRVVSVTTGGIDTVANISDASQINTPTALAVDASGNIYVADAGKHQVLIVKSADKTITAYAGIGIANNYGDGGKATLAALNQPGGLALDANGNLYIADTGNHVIRRVTHDGNIELVAGSYQLGTSGDGGPALAASLFDPRGLAIDAAGNLYIADDIANTIRVISAKDKTINRFAGVGGPFSTYGDGGLAISAYLNGPYGVTVDAAGLAYIADTANHRIRAVLTLPPTYQVAPSATTGFTFSAVAGGPKSDPQTLSVSSNDVPGLIFRVSPDVPWIVSSQSSQSDAVMPANIQITVDPSGLTVDSGNLTQTYNSTITVSATAASPAITKIPVTVTVSPLASTPALTLSAAAINLRGVEKGADLIFSLKVSNAGAGTLSFTTSVKTAGGASWLSVSPASGNATLASPVTIAITASIGGTKAGTYQGTVTLTGNFPGGSKDIPVTLSITPPNAIILISQTGLSFTTAAGAGVPLSQNFGILNVGQGSMDWTAKVSTLSGGNWLQISRTNGTVARPYIDVSFVDVNINPNNLTPGVYYGTISVDALAINRPQRLMVVLNVLPAGSTLGIELRPTGLIFTGAPGVSPSSQDVIIGNAKVQADSFRTSSIGRTFSYTPLTGNLAPSQPAVMRVYPNYTSLPGGAYEFGAVTLQTSDGTLRTVTILTVVAPAASGLRPESRGNEPAAGCNSNLLGVVFRLPQQSGPAGFAAVLGQPTDIELQVTDHCGSLVGPGQTANNAQVNAQFGNGDPNVVLTHTGNGIWKGTWRPVKPSSAPVTINVLAITSTPTAAGGAGLTGTLSSVSTTPTVTSGGVVQAASLAAGVPIAPGSLVTIYGSNLADQTMQPSGGGNLPSQLGGTQVLMGDTLLPLLFTSNGQVNVQVPYSVPVDTQFQLSVQRGNALSVPEQLAVAQAQPGIFTPDGSGFGQGHIYKSDSITLAKPGTPAAAGEVILIYCSGLGAVNPPVPAGTPVDGLHPTVSPVTLLIGGQPANVLFAGLTPGFVGLYQINAVLPQGILAGDTVPVVIQIAGQSSRISPPVTMAVQ